MRGSIEGLDTQHWFHNGAWPQPPLARMSSGPYRPSSYHLRRYEVTYLASCCIILEAGGE